jgi:AcrR family transcriptional regulator
MSSATTGQQGSTLRERKRQRMREDLFEAAMRLFTELPYHEVTVEKICEAAMTSRVTFFRLFGGKAGLLTEYNNRLAVRVREALTQARPDSTEGELHVVAEVIVDGWGPEHTAVVKLAGEVMTDNSIGSAQTALFPDIQEIITEILTRGQDNGELSFQLSPSLVARWFIGTLAIATNDWHERSTSTNAPYKDVQPHTMALLLGGIRNDSAATT